ncbi:ClbS/DfsB family four-helix bundle protein [Demequina sp.]|uniref:ClbS/DfsB family four-helix bundle protein n=1 Tax=Demequina sp. TaxID=2050685 RepID=UPI003D0C25D7
MPSERSDELATKADERLAVLLSRADAAADFDLGVAYHDRRVADLLAHLYAWHVVFDGWVAQDRAGSVPAYPAEGYTWENLDGLNDAFYRAHQDRPYDAIRAMLAASHASMLRLLDTFTQEELTDPARFEWLGGQALGDVADECLGEHYEWGLRTFDTAGMA